MSNLSADIIHLWAAVQLKVPVYLGGMSIVVCFMVAALALGLALAIVPRQVMPWTGLLLLYEWTFTIYYLLYGGFLYLIYLWGSTIPLPAGSLDSDAGSPDSYSGKGLLTWMINLVSIFLSF